MCRLWGCKQKAQVAAEAQKRFNDIRLTQDEWLARSRLVDRDGAEEGRMLGCIAACDAQVLQFS